MRPEPLEEPQVATLDGEVEVELAERRQEAVGVVEVDLEAARVADRETVGERQRAGADASLEDPRRMAEGELDRLVACARHRDPLGVRPEDAHDDASRLLMGSKQMVRVGVILLGEPFELIGRRQSGSSSRRTRPATGTSIQSGRLSSS